MAIIDLIKQGARKHYEDCGPTSDILKQAWAKFWNERVTDETYTLDGEPLTKERLKELMGYPDPVGFFDPKRFFFYCDKSVFAGGGKYSLPVHLKSVKGKNDMEFEPFRAYLVNYFFG
jgi:hypothetical protein